MDAPDRSGRHLRARQDAMVQVTDARGLYTRRNGEGVRGGEEGAGGDSGASARGGSGRGRAGWGPGGHFC